MKSCNKTCVLIVLFPMVLVACSSSDTSSTNPHGPCADAIAIYEEANNVAPSDPGTQEDYSLGNGNYRTFYLGFSGGELQSAFFNWGVDYEGCQIDIE